MDDLFEIIIYIVILVIGGIASVARNRNKRKTLSGPVGQPQAMPDFGESAPNGYNPFEEFLKKLDEENRHEEVLLEENQFEEVDEPLYEVEEASGVLEDYRPEIVTLDSIVTSPEEEVSSEISANEDLHKQAYFTQDNSISLTEITDAIADEDMKYENIFNFSEDIKLGIIYSEILKRKQF
ncbi:MAG: hypothetical protein R6W78_02230 [Bacteroidales bacterium]